MSQWSSTKAKRVLAVLLRIGWSIKRQTIPQVRIKHPEWSKNATPYQINTRQFTEVGSMQLELGPCQYRVFAREDDGTRYLVMKGERIITCCFLRSFRNI